MDHDLQVALLSQCLELTQRGEPYSTEPETFVPVAKYVDADRFKRETALMRSRMNVVGHASQVSGRGDFITRELLGTPIIVVRGHDDRVRAFVNVCRHRGATLELRDHGRCKRFVCPYHAWTYDTEGALKSVRNKEGFPTLDLDDTKLVELQCAEAAGLLWVCPDKPAGPWEPDEATQRLLSELESLGSADSVVFAKDKKVWHANWKLIVDGGLESYHFKVAHRDTIAQFFPDNVSTFEFLGDHVRTVLPRQSIVALADQPKEEWDIRAHTHVVYSVAPNTSLLFQERHYELIMMSPIAIDQTLIEVLTVVPDPGPRGHSENAQNFWALNHAFTTKTLDEDFALGEQIQRGMATGANEFFRFATFEGALSEWHRRSEEKLAKTATDAGCGSGLVGID
ncbi:MAG: SRPBCC family protein [Myxococcota bacterium]